MLNFISTKRQIRVSKPTADKNIKRGNRTVVSRCWRERDWELLFNGCRASVWDDEKVPEADRGDDCKTIWMCSLKNFRSKHRIPQGCIWVQHPALIPYSSFMQMHTLEGNSDDSNNWIPDTHTGDPDYIPCSRLGRDLVITDIWGMN